MCFSASENLVGNLHCASLIVCNFRFFDIYDHSSIFSRLSIMGTYFSQILLPSSAIITQQIWNIIQFIKKWNVSAPAGLASNIIEFAALSYIANDAKYYIAAKNTMRKLFD
eukprot:161179_1